MLHQPLDLLPAQGHSPAVRHDQRGGGVPLTWRRVGVLLAAVRQQLPIAVEGGGTTALLPERAAPPALWGVLWPYIHPLLSSSQVGRSCRQHRVWACEPASDLRRRSSGRVPSWQVVTSRGHATAWSPMSRARPAKLWLAPPSSLTHLQASVSACQV